MIGKLVPGLGIQRIYWDRLPDGAYPTLNLPNGWASFVVWPAPMNPDECWSKLGFTDFDYEDKCDLEVWDLHWRKFLLRLVQFLNPQEPTPAPRSFWSRISGPSFPLSSKEIVAELFKRGEDDTLPLAPFRLGDGAYVCADCGHHALWIGTNPELGEKFISAMPDLFDGLPIQKLTLKWDQLNKL